MKKSRLYLIIILMMCISGVVHGKHIVGGEVTYECKGIDTLTNKARFKITVFVYRDSYSGGAPFDSPAEFGIYSSNGFGGWTHLNTESRSPISTSPVAIETGNPCLEVPKNVGVEKAIYEFEIDLPVSDRSYQIAYQRCCRNNTIFNILSPESTGAAYTVVITPEAQRSCDNSPTFKDFPPVVICADSKLEFDHSAIDADADEIVYSFCKPFEAGGTDGVNSGIATSCNGVTPSPKNCRPPFSNVSFKTSAGYTFDKPLGGSPLVVIDQQTGIITGTPNVIGQFVVGVCAKSFRNGVEIGEIKRDFQFNVTKCEVAVKAKIEAEVQKDKYVLNSCGLNTIVFDNQSTDVSKILSYEWEFPIKGDTIRLNTREATITFPDTGRYVGKLYLNRLQNFEDCKDSATINVNIYPDIQSDFEYAYDTCVAGEITFTDKSRSGAGAIEKWEWQFDSTAFGRVENPKHKYLTPGEKMVNLKVTDKNNCVATSSETIRYFPVPPLVVVEPDRFRGCVPSTINFNNLSTPIDSTYTITWDFGDGKTSSDLSPMHTFEEAGTYAVNVNIESPIGCKTSASFNQWIEVIPSPVAGFEYSPEQPSNFERTVTFTDKSTGAISWLYRIGDIGLTDRNPTYTFPDTGVVKVVQYVAHPTGCRDSAVAYIDVEPLVVLNMPNAFTPNDDGLNDDFKGKGYYDGFKSYKMQIWNRWGELLFETEDREQGWDGRNQSTGAALPAGVYVYSIVYTPPRGSDIALKGHVTLIR